jgi:hypothetical protein
MDNEPSNVTGPKPSGEPAMQDTIPQMPEDPVVDILSRIQISDQILQELDACTWSREKYEKYYQSVDLFLIRDVIGMTRYSNGQDPNDKNVLAFTNLMMWFMYKIATDPWWHRKLCFYNRLMGVNINSSSYWPLQFHPSYIPGNENWNADMLKKPVDFNDEQVDRFKIYDWIDEQIE